MSERTIEWSEPEEDTIYGDTRSNYHVNCRCSTKEWDTIGASYTDEEKERRTTENVYLIHGGVMKIDHIPPEEDNHPWNNDNDPLGPQAA